MESVSVKSIRYKIIALALVIFICALQISCGEERSAYEMMEEFLKGYKLSGVIYSPSVAEGDEGYVSDEFFFSLYGEKRESVSDFAVVFISNLDTVGECGVFVCYSDYDALLVCDMLNRRIDMIKSLSSGVNTEYADSAKIVKRGKCVAFTVLSDNERAEALWKKIL